MNLFEVFLHVVIGVELGILIFVVTLFIVDLLVNREK